MSRLSDLQKTKHFIQYDKDARVRSILKSGCTEFRTAENSYFTQAINELWDLIFEVANRRLDEDIKAEARTMRDEADKVLG